MTIKDYRKLLRDSKWSSHTLACINIKKESGRVLTKHPSGKIIIRKAG